MLKPRQVPLSVSGNVKMSVSALKALLSPGNPEGGDVWWVLQALWTVRDFKTGQTTVLNESLANGLGGKFAKIDLGKVRYATKRLTALGLLVHLGRVPREVPSRSGPVTIHVHVRRVRGALAEGSLGAHGWVFVPSETAARTSTGWGGARQHAGRKSLKSQGKNQERPMNPLRSSANDAIQKPATSIQERPISIQERPMSRIQERPSISGSGSLTPGSGFLLATLGEACATDARTVHPSGSSGEPTRNPSPTGEDFPPSSRPDTEAFEPEGSAVVTQVGFLLPTEGDLASDLDCRADAPKTVSVRRAVPPYPGWSLLKLPVVPNPPLLEADMSDPERAHRLADAYRGAIQARFGKVAWALKRGPIQRTKFYTTLLKGAEVLLEHKIAPAAWACWCCDIWKQYGTDKTKPPPVAWVFSPKRIHERRGWFAAEEETYMGGRIIHSDKMKALMKQYLRMQHEAFRSPDDDVTEIVERYFPGDSYERAVAEVKAESAKVQADLRAKADSGEWLW